MNEIISLKIFKKKSKRQKLWILTSFNDTRYNAEKCLIREGGRLFKMLSNLCNYILKTYRNMRLLRERLLDMIISAILIKYT